VERNAGEGKRNSLFGGEFRFFCRLEERFNGISDGYSGFSGNASCPAFGAYGIKDSVNLVVSWRCGLFTPLPPQTLKKGWDR